MKNHDEIIIVKKHRHRHHLKKEVFITLISLIMFVMALLEIIWLKINVGTFLLVIGCLLNLPWIYDRLIPNHKMWHTIVRVFVIFVIIMMNLTYTNYYGEWYNEKGHIIINRNSIIMNNNAYKYKKVKTKGITRLFVSVGEEEMILHYSRNKGNMEIFLCEFNNNSCQTFYNKTEKNIFYHYIRNL